MQRALAIAACNIAVSLLVLGLKGVAWKLTGSAALFSDALESIVNVAAAAMAWGALWISSRPADANHPYGHAKAELFAAVVEGGLIVAAAGLILQHAYLALLHPRIMSAPLPGLGVSLVATAVNLAWSLVLTRVGRATRAPALVADGRHLLTDVVSSLVLVIGLFASLQLDLPVADPLLAAAVALYILTSGFYLISESVSGLMDAAPAPAVVERIRALVAEHAAGALEAHDLRSRHAGRLSFLEFHLVVPGGMSVADAHEICDRIEAALKADIAGLTITIHVEPDGKAKHHGVLVL